VLNLGRHGCGWWGGPTISSLAPVPEIDPTGVGGSLALVTACSASSGGGFRQSTSRTSPRCGPVTVLQFFSPGNLFTPIWTVAAVEG
jgi:hypothetical protein